MSDEETGHVHRWACKTCDAVKDPGVDLQKALPDSLTTSAGWDWCPVCHHEYPRHFEHCPSATEPTFLRDSLSIAWDEGYSAGFHDTGYWDTKNPHRRAARA